MRAALHRIATAGFRDDPSPRQGKYGLHIRYLAISGAGRKLVYAFQCQIPQAPIVNLLRQRRLPRVMQWRLPEANPGKQPFMNGGGGGAGPLAFAHLRHASNHVTDESKSPLSRCWILTANCPR